MIFNEIYSAYYNVVRAIITAALDHPVTDREMQLITDRLAFSESGLSVIPALKNGSWQLLHPDGTTNIKHRPALPVSLLEKQWLKAVSMDRRVQLFDIDFSFLDDVEPLFTPQDIYVFDRYADGDDYENPDYIRRFRMILAAVKNRTPLKITTTNRHGRPVVFHVVGHHLEYSEKDDKFRLICRSGPVINLGRIRSCETVSGKFSTDYISPVENKCTVTLELTDRRNALERVLLHFAHFEKKAEKTGENSYRIEITYDRMDETELVIRILSFGPFVKVVSPQHFTQLIKDRLKQQMKYDV